MAQNRPPRPDYRNHPDMLRTLGSNGLAYRKVMCLACGTHILDQAILIGEIRKQCIQCKEVNRPSFNRVGDEQTVDLADALRSAMAQAHQALRAVLEARAPVTVDQIDQLNAQMDSLARDWYNGIFSITRL